MSVRSYGFCFTLNNYTEEEVIQIQEFECSYLIFGKEKGEKGTPHLQGFIQFAKPGKTMTAVKKLQARAHWEMTKGNIEQNVVYCSKEGDVFEKGIRPMEQKRKTACGKASLEERWSMAKEGRFEELPPEQIKTYEYIHRKYTEVEDRNELDNTWVYGPSGCGKSQYVRAHNPVFYSKPMSRWWDGYNGEDVVVLDDFDPSHGKYLTYYLKIWADHYAFNAEVKGGMFKIRPKKVLVTSQYRIEDCFETREEIDAIKRRFKEITIQKRSGGSPLGGPQAYEAGGEHKKIRIEN